MSQDLQLLTSAPETSENPKWSPAWWRDDVLGPELERRRPLIDLYENYYEGRYSLAFLPAKLRESMGAMLAATGDNYMPMVVQAAVERMRVQGFMSPDSQDKPSRGSDPATGDRDAWNTWIANGLDEQEPQLWTESCKHGESYLLVWAPDTEGGPPKITFEHPRQMIVARDPADRSRVVAALKRWDNGYGDEYCNLYLPGHIYRYIRREWDGSFEVSGNQVDRSASAWAPREIDGVPAEGTLPLDVGVPVIPITNEPSMLPSRPPQAVIQWPHRINSYATVGLGRSDLADVIGTQDSLNAALVAAQSAVNFQGFMLRYLIGVEQPVDENGNDVPIRVSPGDVMLLDYDPAAGDQKPEIGQLQGADLGQFVDWVVQRIQSLSSRARVPVHYLLSGRVQLPSGEALHAAEAGLTSKIGGKKTAAGPALGRAIQTGYRWTGDDRGKQRWVPDWMQHEYRTESERSDAVGKRVQMLGIPREQGWKDAGYSEDQIIDMRAMIEQQVLQAMRWQAMGVEDPNAPTKPAIIKPTWVAPDPVKG